MAFIVEDGTGRADSTAFISVDYLTEYQADRGVDIGTFDAEDVEAAIVRATEYLSEAFKWKGYKLNSRNDRDGEQSLEWPRQNVYDEHGFYVDDDSVPREIKQATAHLAYYELTNPNGLNPVYVAHDRISMMRAGSAMVQFDTSASGINADHARPVVLAVRDLIWELLEVGAAAGSSGLAGMALRV